MDFPIDDTHFMAAKPVVSSVFAEAAMSDEVEVPRWWPGYG